MLGRQCFPLTIVICMGYTLCLSYSMVSISSRAVCLMGVRKNALGSSVLSFSAGFPDLITAVVLCKRPGMRVMAVSNAFGAYLFNAFIALGVPWAVVGIYADVFPPARGTWYPALVGFGVVAAALLTICGCRFRFTFALGVAMLSLYVVYLTAILYDGLTRVARLPE